MMEAASFTKLDCFYAEYAEGSRATALGSVIDSQKSNCISSRVAVVCINVSL
jgi:hypothetical protein